MLEFQTIEVPLGKLDTSTDPAEMPLGGLTTANNASAQTDGLYTKRFGYTSLTAMSSGMMRLAALGAELLALTATNCYGYNTALGTWIDRGHIANAQTSESSIWRDQSKDLRAGTRATSGNITVHAWIDGDNTLGDVYLQLRSVSDDSVISQAIVDDTAIFKTVHAVVAGQYVFVVYMSHGSQLIRYVRVDTSTGTVGSATTFMSGANVNSAKSALDVSPYSSTSVHIAWATNGVVINVALFNVATLTTTASATVSTETPNTGVAVMATSGETGYLLYATAAGNVRAATFTPATCVQILAPVTIATIGGGADRNFGIVRFSATQALMAWTNTNTGTGASESTTYSTVTSALSPSNVTIHNVRLMSKPFTYSGRFYLTVFAPYDLQYTYFTVRVTGMPQDALPVAMHAYRSAYFNPSPSAMLTDVDQVSAGVFAFAGDVAFKYLSTATPRSALSSFFTDFVSTSRALPVEALGDTYFANGVVARYDGVRPSESNFLLYPSIKSATPGAVGGSGMDNGTYSYICIFESSDAQGNVDRSTTSLPISATTSAGAGLGKVTLVVDHLTMTSIAWGSSGFNQGTVSIFRTKASGSTYQFVGSVAMTPLTPFLTYVDQANDSTIGANRLLYTDGGVLDREPPLPSTQLVVHRSRVWGISSADRRTIFYSGTMALGEGLWFSSAQQFRVDDGGDITALASMDDKLIIFKSDRILYLVGDGPDQLGNNITLQLPLPIAADTGCSDPRSVILTPAGLMFRSAKGMQLLTRSLQLMFIKEPDAYVGAVVNPDYTNYPNTIAVTMVADVQEVRWEIANAALSGGIKLVYNYVTDRWTTHDNAGLNVPVSAVSVAGVYYYGLTGGSIYKESRSTFLDPGNEYLSMELITGFGKLAGKQGLVRHQRVNALGIYKTAHHMLVGYYRDYDPLGSVATENEWTDAQLVTLPREQLSLHLSKQVAQSFRIRMKDRYVSGTLGNGEGYSARSLTIVASVKRGSFEKSMGATAKA